MGGVPEAVRKQVAEGERMHKAMQDAIHKAMNPPEASGDGAGASASPPATTTVAPAPSPEPSETPAAEAPAAEAPAAEAPAEAPAAEAPAEAPIASTPSPDWEQRYRVLQGKYNSEVPRYAEQLRDATKAIKDLERQVAALETRAQPEAAPAPKDSLLTSRDVDEFGEPLIDFATRAAKQALGDELTKLKAEVATLRNSLNEAQQTAQDVRQRQATTEASALDAYLSNLVPDWREINQDPKFAQWAEIIEPLSGASRGQLLRDAYMRQEGPRVAQFFQLFKEEQQQLPKANGGASGPVRREPAVNPDTLVSPAPASGATQPAPVTGLPASQQKRTYSAAEIQQHFADVRNKLFVGREAEQRAIELDIAAAGREGRIV